MNRLFFLLLGLPLLCVAQNLGNFKPELQPSAPDYSVEKNWSALPFRKDAGDFTLKKETWISDSLKAVDVFYIYPTLYRKGNTWCADLNNEKLNKQIDKFPVRFHTSIFNSIARVYAPRYRQAIIESFYDTTGNGNKALDFAYQDVKASFEYYMKYYNHGRPIIIVSHSQGTAHARRLLKEYFDTPDMKKQLVCAYIVGYGIYPENYTVLEPCLNPTQTNCYVSWASFKDLHIPSKNNLLYGKFCVNPITWTTDTSKAFSKCGIFLNLNHKPYATNAKIKDQYLWVNTKLPIVKRMKVLHVVDFNLFWYEIRKNASDRLKNYLNNL